MGRVALGHLGARCIDQPPCVNHCYLKQPPLGSLKSVPGSGYFSIFSATHQLLTLLRRSNTCSLFNKQRNRWPRRLPPVNPSKKMSQTFPNTVRNSPKSTMIPESSRCFFRQENSQKGEKTYTLKAPRAAGFVQVPGPNITLFRARSFSSGQFARSSNLRLARARFARDGCPPSCLKPK